MYRRLMRRPTAADFSSMNQRDRYFLIVCGLSWAVGNLASYLYLEQDRSEVWRWVARIALLGFVFGGIRILRRSRYLWAGGIGEHTMGAFALGGFGFDVVALLAGWDDLAGAGFVTGLMTSGIWFASIARNLRRHGRWLWPATIALGFEAFLVSAATIGNTHHHAIFAMSALVFVPLVGWGVWPGSIHDMRWDSLRWWPRGEVAKFHSWTTIGLALFLTVLALAGGAIAASDGFAGGPSQLGVPLGALVACGFVLLILGRRIVWRASVTTTEVRLSTIGLKRRSLAVAEMRVTEIVRTRQGVVVLTVTDREGRWYLLMCDDWWLDGALRQLVRHAAEAGVTVAVRGRLA
jgi:hypothetical protein